MALQDSGSGAKPAVSMSISDINVELGALENTPIDFGVAASSFSGILPGTVEMLEFYNKTFSVGTGPYGTRALHEFTFVEDIAGGQVEGFSNGELVSAAEKSTTDLTSPFDTLADETDFVGFEVDDGQLTNGDKIYENSTGAQLTNLRPTADFSSGTQFMLDNDADKIFQIDSSGVVSNVTDRTPAKPPTPTGTSPSSTQIDLSITNANTIVTRTYQISRSLTSGGTFSGVGTVSPSAKGNIGNTSVTTTYSDTGLSAGTTYYYKVRGHNTFGNTLSDESAGITTAAAATSWGSISDFNMHLGSSPPSSQTLESGEKTLTLTNGSGNTTITVNQPVNSSPPPTLEIKVGDSSGNYNLISSYTTTPAAIPSRTTYYMKFKLTQNGTKDNSAEDCQIRFTNNSENRDFNINVKIGGLFP